MVWWRKKVHFDFEVATSTVTHVIETAMAEGYVPPSMALNPPAVDCPVGLDWGRADCGCGRKYAHIMVTSHENGCADAHNGAMYGFRIDGETLS